MQYVIQCKDHTTKRVGCFGFDPVKAQVDGYFTAITEVFKDLQAFYDWAKISGIKLEHCQPFNFHK